MMRRLITALLLIATVAGPQWCCCRVRADEDATKAVAAQHAPAIHKSCCAAKAGGDAETPAPAGDHSCPCRKQSQDVPNVGGMSEAAASTLRSPADFGQLLFLDASTCSVEATVSECFKPSCPASLPVKLSGYELLRAYHVWRC